MTATKLHRRARYLKGPKPNIKSAIFGDRSAILLARIVGAGGKPITRSDIATARYSVLEAYYGDVDLLLPIRGHDNVELDVSRVVFEKLRADRPWTEDTTGYNFRHAIDARKYTAFPFDHTDYEVRYELTTVDEQRIHLCFFVRAV